MGKACARHARFRDVGPVLKEVPILALNALMSLGQKCKKESVFAGLLLGKSRIPLVSVTIVWSMVVVLVLGVHFPVTTVLMKKLLYKMDYANALRIFP